MILVTGGTGLVGSHLLYKLLDKGEKVRALCRANSCKESVKQVFQFYSAEKANLLFDQIEWFEGDLLDYFSLLDALENVRQVYHCAAMVSFKPSDADEMFTTNTEGTANLVTTSIERGIEKFCYVSSIATLGAAVNGHHIDESTFWQNDDNHSVYSQSKFQAEMEVWRGTKEGLKAIVVNPSVIIGPGNPDRSSGQLFKSVANGMKFYTPGSTGFVDVRDVTDAMIALTNSEACNERFVVSSENLNYEQFLTKVATAYHTTPPSMRAGRIIIGAGWRLERLRYLITRKEPRITKETARSSQNRSFYSSNKLKELLQWQFIPIDQSVTETVAFFIQNKTVV